MLLNDKKKKKNTIRCFTQELMFNVGWSMALFWEELNKLSSESLVIFISFEKIVEHLEFMSLEGKLYIFMQYLWFCHHFKQIIELLVLFFWVLFGSSRFSLLLNFNSRFMSTPFVSLRIYMSLNQSMSSRQTKLCYAVTSGNLKKRLSLDIQWWEKLTNQHFLLHLHVYYFN